MFGEGRGISASSILWFLLVIALSNQLRIIDLGVRGEGGPKIRIQEMHSTLTQLLKGDWRTDDGTDSTTN